MPREPNPIDDPELYDVLKVAGKPSPGQVTLSGHDRDIGWDIKKGSGQKGASMTRTSEDPVEFTATFFLADEEDQAKWPEFRELLLSTISGSKPKAFDTYHPDLAEVGITSIVLKKLGGTVHDGKGGQTKIVKLLEYRPAQAATGSPSGSSTKREKEANDPNAAAKAELAALVNQYQNTPWG